MTDLIIQNASWDEDSEALTKLRSIVFVEEQNVPIEIEIDGLDDDCLHVKALFNGEFVGTGRLLADGFIGRMCVLKSHRGKQVGSLMLKNLIQQAQAAGYPKIQLNAQISAIDFYQRNGFALNEDIQEFLDAGILHRQMYYTL